MFESATTDPGSEGLTRAARIFIVIAVLGALGTMLSLTRALSERSTEPVAMIAVSAVASVLAFITAKGIEAQRRWAKYLAYAQGLVMLLNVPIGTVIGVFVLGYVFRASKAGLFDARAEPAA